MDKREKVHELADGELVLWEEQGASIHLQLANKFGDPVELNAEEARELARVLLKLADSIE